MNSLEKHRVLITGAAGFIGFHVAKFLLKQGMDVVGIDNLNDYYTVTLKEDRLQELKKFSNFNFHQLDINNRSRLEQIFSESSFNIVIHLAAQAGVRYSLENPHSYSDSNLGGFVNILEMCRSHKIAHFIYASSSSVYGMNKKIPFSTDDNVDHPISLYAATKRANELIAYSYSHLYGIPCTGLRFFTVYGPWGRPDMAYFGFTKAIAESKPIKVYNNGEMERDFTYVDDVVDAIHRLLDVIPEPETELLPPYQIYNVGNNRPVKLMDFIKAIEVSLGQEAIKEYYPMQPGDVLRTYADIEPLKERVGFEPKTTIEEGMMHFVEWYKNYYNV